MLLPWQLWATIIMITYNCNIQISTHKTGQSFVGSNPVAVTETSDIASVSSKEFLDMCGFTLKYVRDMIRANSQMHRTNKYSQQNSIIWPVWLNGRVFVYEISGCGFESRCIHFDFFVFSSLGLIKCTR